MQSGESWACQLAGRYLRDLTAGRVDRIEDRHIFSAVPVRNRAPGGPIALCQVRRTDVPLCQTFAPHHCSARPGSPTCQRLLHPFGILSLGARLSLPRKSTEFFVTNVQSPSRMIGLSSQSSGRPFSSRRRGLFRRGPFRLPFLPTRLPTTGDATIRDDDRAFGNVAGDAGPAAQRVRFRVDRGEPYLLRVQARPGFQDALNRMTSSYGCGNIIDRNAGGADDRRAVKDVG